MTIRALVESSPPGQLNDVFADIRLLTSSASSQTTAQSDENGDENIVIHLRNYHQRQFEVVEVDDKKGLLNEFNVSGIKTYKDVAISKEWEFDDLTGRVSNVRAYTTTDDATKQIATVVQEYLSEHYPSHSACSIVLKNDEIKVSISGNKFNTANYWTGKWKSQYSIPSPSASSSSSNLQVKGWIEVDVHYYEDGNVRLLTCKELSFDLPRGDSGKVFIKEVEKLERQYQEELNRAFGVLGEGRFKELRRALPVTRQKIKWESVAAMRLGRDVVSK